MKIDALKPIFDLFQIEGTATVADDYGSGHINDTYRVHVDTPEGEALYILQRINHLIFTQPVELMDNVQRVTAHVAQKILARGGDPLRETLTLVPTREGENYALVGENYWRVYLFVSGATGYDMIEDERHVTAAAKAFAQFQKDVADMPAPRLHETIPGFGDTGWRFEQFEQALAADVAGRAKECQAEIDFCLARKADANVLMNLLREKKIPERITHYDTKINNVLIDDATGKGLCVIDLDTVMPGVAMYDFGDSVRTATALGAEDETDLSKVGFSLERFELLAEGYLSVAKEFLTDIEIDHLAFAAKIVAFTIGLRFIADHLAGDVYFKTHRENQNLDRCRTQLKTVADMEARFDEMKTIVDKYRA
ncbi:MAG: aminoglycoside phosphotransferase family protein [Phycisphaerales bacterium]|jgi:Ser/Thr protein kinase RdoA (MazF antagonist)|nr:aminoglycoside phosphotransferase family protein [Phycisphaerales bacterium]MBT7170736.1 aminoglycoside phosphotransferase family protein [Phycisphaerales bacterium]